MKKTIFTTTALVCCFMICFAAIADLAGKWTGTLKIPDGTEIPLTYEFKVDGAKLSGSASTPDGSVTVDDGKIDGDKFSFNVTVNGAVYAHTGKMYADSLGIDIDFSGNKVHTTLKRAGN